MLVWWLGSWMISNRARQPGRRGMVVSNFIFIRRHAGTDGAHWLSLEVVVITAITEKSHRL